MSSQGESRGLLSYLPLMMIPLIMLPRLISSQFGFFDDAVILSNSEGILGDSWSPTEEAAYGRFRPMKWYYYAFIYSIVGKDPFWFFVGNTVLWMALTYGLIFLVRALGGNRAQVLTACILFAMNSSTMESTYTLSKTELLQLPWILLSILLIGILTKSTLQRWLGVFLSSMAVFLACLFKETSVLIFPISLGWSLLTWVQMRIFKTSNPASFQAKRNLFCASILGVSAYILLRSKYIPFGFIEEGYPSHYNFTLEHIKNNARIWADLLIRDYLYLIPLFILPLIGIVRRQRINHLDKVFDSGIWISVWIGLLIPWIFTQEYYLMPFALGAAYLGSSLLGWNLDILRGSRSNWRIPSAIPLVIALTFFLLTIPSLATKARAQLAIDAANDEMLTYVLENAPQDSVLLINIQDPNEYVGNFITLVNDIGGRQDLIVEHFQFQDSTLKGWDKKEILIVSPFVENQFYPSMRMGVFEMPSRTWNTSLLEYLGDQGESVLEIKNSSRSALIDTPRAFCFLVPSLNFCQRPHSPLDNRLFAYGWEIYRLENPQDR